MAIRNAKDLKRFLARVSQFQYLEIYVAKGVKLVFPGVKWIASADIDVAKGGTVEFPDLEFVADTLVLRAGGSISIPKLREVGGMFSDESADEYHGSIQHDFDQLIPSCTGMVTIPETFIVNGAAYSHADKMNVDRWLPIANDAWYTLYYNPKTRKVKAGCRNFNTLHQAIRHWTEAVKSHDNARQNRALMFILALTFLQEALK